MGIFFVYILKSSVCLAMFYLFYRVLLSKETFHRFNRMALLGVLALSCLVPLVEVTTHDASDVGQTFLSLEEMLMMVEMEPAEVWEETSAPFPWRALMLLVYVAGILFFVLRHLWSLERMLRLLGCSRKECLEGGITLFVHDHKEVAPFSWMKNIALSESDLEEGREAVLTHERAHIHNLHSWDLLLAEACIFLQWFNPAAWLLKQELQTVHEYEADEWVIENGIDAKTYQLLIIKKAVGARLYSIANSFNHSSLKKRITMMIKKKSNPWARMKCLVALPLATVAVVAFARPEVSNELDEISSVKVNDLTSIVKEFGQEKEDTLPKTTWHEAVVWEQAPQAFMMYKAVEGKKPLFVIDGAPFPAITFDGINPDMIESLSVVLPEEAVKLYGEKAKDGAVVIVSKRSQEVIVHEGMKFNVPVRTSSDKEFMVSAQVREAETSRPIMGASVVLRGTDRGTMTDKDGRFSLSAKLGDVIIVSFVGYQKKTIIVKDEKPLTILMKDDVQSMEETLVIGHVSEEKGVESVVDIPEVKGEDAPKAEGTVVVFDIPKGKVEKTETPQQEEVVFVVVEEMPQFPGGMQAAMEFLGKNIKYPVEAQKAKIEGRVIVRFVVGKDGGVSNVEVMRGVSPELDAEAVRVVSSMPKWVPGKQRGKAVPVKYTMPIVFRLKSPSPEKEEAASYQQINLKVDKDASQASVDMVKEFFENSGQGNYREYNYTFDKGENKKVEKLPTGGVRYNNGHAIMVRVDNGKFPLIVVDGKIKGNGMDVMKEIPIEQIKSIEVVKDEIAFAESGDKANDGVIKVTTKKKEN